MFRHKTLSWGVLAFALMVTNAAAQTTPRTKPAKPTELRAKAIARDIALLTWADNATNEAEYHVEIRTAEQQWTDLGPVPPNATFLRIFSLQPETTYFFRLRAKNSAGWSPYSNESAATAWYDAPPSCTASDTVMCLQNGRYRVQATFDGGPGVRGLARTNRLSEESGLFWFFDESNVEAIIKVLDGCTINKHRWVYTTGLTDLRVLLVVIDTQTGATATYMNEGGAPFQPVNDTDALPCE